MRKLLLLLFMALFAWAGGSDLSSKIVRLQQLPKSERYKLMNEIKWDLARMNEAQRQKALGKLRASMHAGSDGKGKGMHHRYGKHDGSGMHGRAGKGMGDMLHRNQNIEHRMEQTKHRNPAMEKRPAPMRPEQQRPSTPDIPGIPHGR